jgi:hypothetical protein
VALATLGLLVGTLGVTASGAASQRAQRHHPWTSVTLSTQRIELGAHVKVTFCWHNAPLGWIADLTTGPNPRAALQSLYSKRIVRHNGCLAKRVTPRHRGQRPFSGQLITPHGATFVTAATLLNVYGPTPGWRFLSSILYPKCHGKGSVVIGGASYAFTCSMRAITSHLTDTPTSCRSVTLTLGSTDAIAGDPTSKGKTIYEIAQNQYPPFFSRFPDNTVTRVTLQLSGSEFWAAFKSTDLTSRLYYLNSGATADCFTSNGKA